MLKVNFYPESDSLSKGPTVARWDAPSLSVDGRTYNLSELPDGATATHPVLGKVLRNGDEYECTITLRYRHRAPKETRFPEPIIVTANGPIGLPPYAAPEPEEPADDLA